MTKLNMNSKKIQNPKKCKPVRHGMTCNKRVVVWWSRQWILWSWQQVGRYRPSDQCPTNWQLKRQSCLLDEKAWVCGNHGFSRILWQVVAQILMVKILSKISFACPFKKILAKIKLYTQPALPFTFVWS